MLRTNPLLSEPPVVRGQRQHRIGELILRDVQEYFAHIDGAVEDIYKGVHLTPHPIVAAAYALNRRAIEENDYGLLDIVDPPVLVGLRVEGAEHLDADGYTTAMNIDKLAKELVENDISPNDLDDAYVQEQFDLHGYSWDNLHFDPYLGLGGIGGEIGNRPELGAFLEAVREQMSLLNKLDSEDLLKNALRLAYEIIPQSRVCRDVGSDEVVALVVLAPYTASVDNPLSVEMPTPPFHDFTAFEDLETPEGFNRTLLDEGTVLYGDPDDANRWHGTSLSIAETAFPDLLTPTLVEKARKAGSPYDLEDFEEEDEDYDD